MPPRSRRVPPAVLDALAIAAPLATRWIERILAAHDPPLSVAQYLALRSTAREPLTAAEVARRAGVTDAAVSQLVSSLERSGLLERRHVEDDRRRQTLVLSKAGERALATVSSRLRTELAFAVGDLPAPEVDGLTRLLEHLGTTLGGTPPPARPAPPPPKARPRPQR